MSQIKIPKFGDKNPEIKEQNPGVRDHKLDFGDKIAKSGMKNFAVQI